MFENVFVEWGEKKNYDKCVYIENNELKIL